MPDYFGYGIADNAWGDFDSQYRAMQIMNERIRNAQADITNNPTTSTNAQHTPFISTVLTDRLIERPYLYNSRESYSLTQCNQNEETTTSCENDNSECVIPNTLTLHDAKEDTNDHQSDIYSVEDCDEEVVIESINNNNFESIVIEDITECQSTINYSIEEEFEEEDSDEENARDCFNDDVIIEDVSDSQYDTMYPVEDCQYDVIFPDGDESVDEEVKSNINSDIIIVDVSDNLSFDIHPVGGAVLSNFEENSPTKEKSINSNVTAQKRNVKSTLKSVFWSAEAVFRFVVTTFPSDVVLSFVPEKWWC